MPRSDSLAGEPREAGWRDRSERNNARFPDGEAASQESTGGVIIIITIIIVIVVIIIVVVIGF